MTEWRMTERVGGVIVQDVEWDVTRSGHTVRIDVYAAADISGEDADAMVAATEEFLNDGVRLLQMNGPVLRGYPPHGVAYAIRTMWELAQKYGKTLMIVPA